MNRILKIVVVIIASASFVSLWAQDARKKAESKPEHKVRVPLVIPVYLGHSGYTGGPISKPIFDSLMKQGLTAHDSAGTPFSVTEFAFNYAERNFYEDSSGENSMWLTDYMLEYCKGNTLSPSISQSLYSRTKAGDTVYIDHITLERLQPIPNDVQIFGKGMKFEITR
jgi:hypothetical protein